MYLGATMIGKGNDFGWIDGSEWNYDNFFNGMLYVAFIENNLLPRISHARSWRLPDHGHWRHIWSMGECGLLIETGCGMHATTWADYFEQIITCLIEHYSTPSCTSGPWQEEQIVSGNFIFQISIQLYCYRFILPHFHWTLLLRASLFWRLMLERELK